MGRGIKRGRLREKYKISPSLGSEQFCLFCSFRVHIGGLQILPLLLIACVSFDKFLKLSMLQFSFLKK